MVDKDQIREKLHYMRLNIGYLEQFKETDLAELDNDPVKEAAAVRMLQVVLEAMLDICCHIIARKGWGMPTTYCEVVSISESHGLIPSELEGPYLKMARFRNRVVHHYNDISNAEVLEIIKNRLDYFHPFMKNIISLYLDSED